jgi:hypothetical protein
MEYFTKTIVALVEKTIPIVFFLNQTQEQGVRRAYSKHVIQETLLHLIQNMEAKKSRAPTKSKIV